MYTLSNAELTVSILDPIADVARLGSRYCTGGYIWQVNDTSRGELLSGPEYPKEPNTFDGQGMPDMFQRALGAEEAPVGGEVGCIGVGRVRRTSPIEPFDVRYNPEVIEFVRWEVISDIDTLIMRTESAFQKWAYHLKRSVTLMNRTIYSQTEIQNQGTIPLPVRWFAHPFFPLMDDNILCCFSIPVFMPENPGYYINPNGYVTRKINHDWRRGWYQPLEYARTGNSIEVVQRHPKIGQVIVKTDFMPTFLPIWGNDCTFSFEPYYEKTLNPGEGAAWSIEYQF